MVLRAMVVGILVVAHASAAIASEATCDPGRAGFESSPAKLAKPNAYRTQVPAVVAVEHAGFPTQDAAAKCFGERYHGQRESEYVTVIVAVGDGWGYLTPGRGPRSARKVFVLPLLEAYRDAGFEWTALAHTHPYGTPYFSGDDLVGTSRSGRPFYLTNWRNETYRVDPGSIGATTRSRRWATSARAMFRLAGAKGFPGTRVE